MNKFQKFTLNILFTFLTAFFIMFVTDNEYVKTKIMGDTYHKAVKSNEPAISPYITYRATVIESQDCMNGMNNKTEDHYHYSLRHWLLVIMSIILLVGGLIKSFSYIVEE